jgi:hypothetical protein
MPKGLKEVGQSCFEGSKISEVKLSEQLEILAPKTFSSCSIREIIIPKAIAAIQSGCFRRCKTLEVVTFEQPSSLTVIEASAFSGTMLRTIVIPQSVTFIGKMCFASCQALGSVVFETPSCLQEIETGVFAGCALHSVSIPHGCRRISVTSFQNCVNLVNVEIPEGLKPGEGGEYPFPVQFRTM